MLGATQEIFILVGGKATGNGRESRAEEDGHGKREKAERDRGRERSLLP